MCIRNPQAVLGPTLEKMRHSAAMGAATYRPLPDLPMSGWLPSLRNSRR